MFPRRSLAPVAVALLAASPVATTVRGAEPDPGSTERGFGGGRPALTARPLENPAAERQYKSTVLMDLLDPAHVLRDRGVELSLTSTGDGFVAATDGGYYQHRHEGYFVRNTATLDVAGDKLLAGRWQGLSFHASGVLQSGERLSSNDLDLYQNPSSVTGHNTFRLNELWFEQKVSAFGGQKFDLRLGQLAAHDEFALQDMHSSFVGNAFGNPQMKTNLRSPSTPAGQPGARLRWEPTERVYLKAGVYNGDSDRFWIVDKSGVSFRFKDDAVVAGEVGYRFNIEPRAPGLAGNYKVGLLHDFGHFTRYFGGPARDYGNDLVYVMATQEIWRPRDAGGEAIAHRRGLSAAVGATFTPNREINVSTQEYVGELRYTGLFPGRPHDTTGLAVADAEFSGRFRDVQRRRGSGRGGSEVQIELNHDFFLGPAVSLQPNVQVFSHPYGDAGRGPVLLLGLRHLLTF